MGRSKEPQAPAFSSSEIRYGNKVVGKTYQDPYTGSIISKYYPDPAEEERRALIQQKINQIAPTLGVTAPELAAQYNQTEQAYVDDATSKFLDQYNPTLRDLREDIASRFGTLATSQFVDNLNNLEKVKASAFSDIINQGKMLKYGLAEQEEARKLSALQSLMGLMGSDQSNFMSGMSAPQDTAGMLNGLLNNQWTTMLNDYRQNMAMKQAAKNNNQAKWYNANLFDLL
jgi:hypothetical protein